MISFLIVLFLITLCFGLILKYRLRGIVATVGLIASDTDSAGVMYWIIGYFPIFKMPIRLSILLVAIVALYRLFKRGIIHRARHPFVLFYLMPLLVVSCIVVGLSLVRGQGLVIGLSELIWLGIPFFFIWIAGSLRQNHDNLFPFFVVVQCFVAMLVILCGSVTGDINGASYADKIGGEGWAVDPRDMINASIAFFNFNKYDLSVMKFGHFHNPNSLGVYSAMLMVVSLYGLFRRGIEKIGQIRQVIWLVPLGIAIVLWMNSLTRGPVLLLMVWWLFFGLRRIRSRKILFALAGLGAIGLIFIILNFENISILRYLVVQSGDTSVVSRLAGYQFAFNAIINDPLVGRMPSPQDAVPHILALKIAAYYGVPAGLLITVPFVHMGVYIVRVIKNEYSKFITIDFNYGVSICCVLIGALLTNGVVVYVLFWTALSEALIRFGFLEQFKICDKNGVS